jgi:FtsP/CotA-like multicopper oxidase with cupredoxin domain
MNDRLRLPSRRALLLAGAAGLFAVAEAGAATERPKKKPKKAAAKSPAPTGTPLPIPRIVEPKPGETFDLVAEPAIHAFQKDRPVSALGYGGTYMGPAIRLTRRTAATIRLVNRLDRPTNVHWHGALVEGRADGGSHPGIEPGGDWTTTLLLDQPAATLWYHAHVHGHTAEDVHAGLAGLLLVEDPSDPISAQLPAEWGVDDLPLVLQDRDFDADGRPVYEKSAATVEHGFRGSTLIVNGVADPVARVPQRLVRLRILNASGARTYRLFFEDQRPFRMIAGDAGRLPAPAELTYLPLAPGERAEIVVDFADGASALMSGPDDHEHRVGDRSTMVPDPIGRSFRLVGFETVRDGRPSRPLPATLASLPALPKTTMGLKRRRFELRIVPGAGTSHDHAAMAMAGGDHAAMGHGGAAVPVARAIAPLDPVGLPHGTINGRTFDPARIDETVGLGTLELWEVVSPDMAHPFHVHGAHFRVLSEDGDRPKLWNGGWKDTVLVENSAELLVSFTRTAAADRPFLFHCHLLEHEDAGMMGTFTVA